MPTAAAIARKIKARAYHAPGRARAAISRSDLPARDKSKLLGLVNDWEQAMMPVVGSLPAARPDDEVGAVEGELEGEVIELPRRSSRGDMPLARGSMPLALGARISAPLTVRGVALLHESRERVNVPDNLLDKCGVWETSLSEFMVAFGPHLESGQEEIVEGMAIVIHPEGP